MKRRKFIAGLGGVGAVKPLGRDPNGLAANERLHRIGQLRGAGDFGSVDQHRNDEFAEPHCRLDLDANEILGIDQANFKFAPHGRLR